MAAPFTGPVSCAVSSVCVAGFRQKPVLNWLLGLPLVLFEVSGWCPSRAGPMEMNPAKALRHGTCRLQHRDTLHTIGPTGEGIGAPHRPYRAISASCLFLK